MSTKRLLMRKLREILRLKFEGGLGHRAIARSCGIGVGTVSSYVRRAERVGLGWPLPEGLDDTALEERLFPPSRCPVACRAMPDLAGIHQELKRPGVTLLLLWVEYAEAHPGGYRYSRFCEIYRRWARKLQPSMRQTHKAGEKAFVDFSGQRPSIVDRHTGEAKAVELFVGTLGASSRIYAEATAGQDLGSWIGAHTRMVEEWGGCPEVFVPDNLKSGITTPCRYEPEVNRTYREWAEHYGASVIPARPYRPRDKAKVEVSVQVAERWILARLRNRVFFSLAELNAAIRVLLVEINGRPMRRLGKSRHQLFEEIDRPMLRPLPPDRYEIAEWKECRVNIDYHVEVEHNLYSVPYALVHESVDARFTSTTVEIFHRSRRVTSHARLFGRGKVSTLPEHMPSSHRAHAEWTPSRILSWAEKTGPATARVLARILQSFPHPEQGFRGCLGILRLGQSHGAGRVEAACRRAERVGSFRYQTVKNILSSKVDQLPFDEDAPTPAAPAHDNVRGASYYSPQEVEC